MNSKLLLSCVGLWLAGLVGMVVARALFLLGPGELGFELPARLWMVGGLSYVVCGAAGLRGRERSDRSKA